MMKPLLGRLAKTRWKLWLAVLVGAPAVLVMGFALLVRTEWFEEKIRQTMVARLQEVTSGDVEIGSLSLDPVGLTGFTVVVRDVSLGRSDESSHPPFLQIPSLRLDVGIESFLRRDIALRAMEVESPRLELVTADDGSTNLPSLGTWAVGTSLPAGWFDLVADRLDVRQGRVSWNGLQFPVSLASEQFSLETRFEEASDRYRASVKLGSSSAQIGDYEPVVTKGDLEFFLYRDRLEAPHIRLAAGESQVEASLRVDDFRRPRVIADYQLRAELSSWADSFEISAVERGGAEVLGKASWDIQGGKLEYSGQLELKGLSLRSSPVAVEQIEVVGQYEGDGQHLAIHDLEVSVPGGRFAGKVDVEIFTDAAPRYRVAGKLDLELPSALEALDLPSGKVSGLPWTSVVAGQLQGEGAGADEFEAALSLQLAAPEALEEGQSPLAGQIELTYNARSRQADISLLRLSTPSADFDATGSVSLAGRSSLAVHAKTKSPDALAYLAEVAAPRWADSLAALVAEASFDGDLGGYFFSKGGPAYELEGRAQARGLRLLGHDWKSFEAEVQLRPDQLRILSGHLKDGAATATMSITLPLGQGGLARDSPLAVDLRLEEIPLDRLVSAAGWEIPIKGRAGGRIQVAGSVARPRGSAKLEISDGEAWGRPFDLLAGGIEFSKEKITLRKFDLSHQDATIRATAQFEPPERRFRLDAEGKDWGIEQLKTLPPSFGGTLHFELGGSGRLGTGEELFEEFALSGLWDVESVNFNRKLIGSLKGSVETVDREVTLDWEAELLTGRLEGAAHVYPTENGKLRGRTQFAELSVVELARLADVSLDKATGTIDGHCTFSAASWDLDNLMAEGQVTRLEGEFAAIPTVEKQYSIWNPFPMRWGYARNTLRLDRMRLLGEGTDVEINGEVSFSPEERLDVDVSGTFNLAVLESFRSDLQARGSSTLEMKIAGSLQAPQLEGRMELNDASLRSVHLTNGLSQVEGVVTFTGDRMNIEQVTATTGGGRLRLSGNSSFGADTANYRVNVEVEQVRLRYPTSIRSVFDGRLTLSGAGFQSLLEGNVVVHRAAIEQEFELGVVLASLGEPTPTPPSNPLLENMQLDIQIRSVPDLQVETSLIRNMQSHVDLRLAGTALSPALLGRVSITQGDVNFRGSRYVINRGDIEFVNPFRIEPTVNFQLESRMRDVDIALTLSGPARKMNLSYRSDPPLQFNELVYLIASGRDPGDPVLAARQTVQQQHLLQTGANTVMSQALAQPGSRRVQRFFGVSRLKVDPQAGGAEFNPSARISTDQPITNDLTLTYSYDLSSAQQQTVRVEWAPTRRWSMIVTRDENGLVGADLIYKKRLR